MKGRARSIAYNLKRKYRGNRKAQKAKYEEKVKGLREQLKAMHDKWIKENPNDAVVFEKRKELNKTLNAKIKAFFAKWKAKMNAVQGWRR